MLCFRPRACSQHWYSVTVRGTHPRPLGDLPRPCVRPATCLGHAHLSIPAHVLLSPGSDEPPCVAEQPLTAASARPPASLSLCSIFCNCVLTPRENSQELARLEVITGAYQVRPSRAPFGVLSPDSVHTPAPSPRAGHTGEGRAVQGLSWNFTMEAPSSAPPG